MKQTNWTRVLVIMLAILAAYALLYVTASVLARFTHVIILFALAAMAAYILKPLVDGLVVAVRVRWVAIFLTYCLVAVGVFALGVLLFTPFIEQTQSLVDNLHTPSSSSLVTIRWSPSMRT